jgi:gamma-tubulin complex component 2
MQELLVIDDLLSALVGIEGRYISIKRVRGKEGYVVFQIDSSMDLALQVNPKCTAHWITHTEKDLVGA